MGQIVKVYKDGVGYQVLNTNNIGDALEAGDNISINGNEISAVDTKYSAGTGLRLSGTTFSLNVNYGADLNLSIDPSTFVLTAQLKDQNGSNIGSAQTIDLPLESVVVSGTYNAQTKEVELTLKSGDVISFSVADLVSGLQEELVVGNGINIDSNNEISVDTSVIATQADLNTKQDTLTAGTNISIDANNEISAVDTKYSAGTGINIDANNVISSTVTPGQTYTAGNGINIDQNNEISVDTSVVATQTDIANFFDKTSDDADDIDDTNSTNKFVTATDKSTWNGKQDELIAGTNIQIAADGKTISATDTKYSAGDGIDIDQNNEISVDNTIARVDDINTKIFQFSGRSDFTNAQAIYDWYDEGKLPVIEYGLKLYTPSGSHIGSYETQLYVYFESIQENNVQYIYFVVNDDEVSEIYMGGYDLEQDYLRKNNNYYYVPTGNYNPATKKYVDDAVASITPGQTYTAGNGINIDQNNEISNTLPGPTIAATAPTGTEGALWYDTTNDVLKTYNGTNWIAVGEDSNMKMFIISGYGDNTTGQAIYDYYKSGKTPFARWGNIVYAVKKYSTSGTSFQLELSAGFHGADVVSNTYSASYEDELVISGDNDVVNATMPQGGEIIKYLATDKNYSTPYTPQYNGSPATKKYVDDNIVTYTAGTNISIDANNEISAVDTTYTAGTGINIDSNNVISATATPGQTYTAGNGINISQNNEISADTTVVATKTDLNTKQDTLTAGENTSIDNICESDMQGPCPSGFHVPTVGEWNGLINIMKNALSLQYGPQWMQYLHMPYAGHRDCENHGDVDRQRIEGFYATSIFDDATPGFSGAYYLLVRMGDTVYVEEYGFPVAMGFSVRGFKNEYITPTSNWTVVQGTLGSTGIFRDQANGLISITDGTTGYTIMDKNLGATTVYNDGDTFSEANCGKYYQRGNNYGFPRSGSITTSSTQVDASGYGPGNYYSSSTFITTSTSPFDWSSVENKNLRGGVSQGTWCRLTISAEDTKYSAGTGINIDANNVISATATPGQTYTAGNGINISQNNEISADTSVVATKTDVGGMVSKGTNETDNILFSITNPDASPQTTTAFGPDGVICGNNNGLFLTSVEVNKVSVTDSLGKSSELGSNRLALYDSNNMAQTTFIENGITVNNTVGSISETYQFSGGGNNQIARLKDVKTYTAGNGININANNEISNTLPGPTIAATAPTGTEGALWYDTTNDVLMAHDGTAWKEAGTQMKVLSYGHSTWQDFLNAYNENAIVYCRASSNSNPGSGVQGRMAFMAFVSINSSTGLPTNVEFQYYRSRSDHNTQANQLDEVYVYKLESNGTWSVTQRNTGAKAVAGTGINLAFGSGNMTISADTTTLATKTDLNSKQNTLVSGTNIKTVNNESLLGSGNIAISAPTYTAGENITIDQNNEISAVDTTYNAGKGIVIGDMIDRYEPIQGPCDTGFHIPLGSELGSLRNMMEAFGGQVYTVEGAKTYLHMPLAGRLLSSTGNLTDSGVEGYYWGGNYAGSYHRASNLEIGNPYFGPIVAGAYYLSTGYSIRPFKDEPAIPDSSWTQVYTHTAGGIYYNSTLGLISLSSDGTNWITIADKNLGATVVYNNGDALSESNCGKFYQRGNNYGFDRNGAASKSYTKVNASSYGPGEYSSSTFVTDTYTWMTTDNETLWANPVIIENAISNTGVTSVNGQTGDVTLPAAEIGLSTETGNVLTAGAKIWTGDETDMPASPNQNTLYFCY